MKGDLYFMFCKDIILKWYLDLQVLFNELRLIGRKSKFLQLAEDGFHQLKEFEGYVMARYYGP